MHCCDKTWCRFVCSLFDYARCFQSMCMPIEHLTKDVACAQTEMGQLG